LFRTSANDPNQFQVDLEDLNNSPIFKFFIRG